MGGGEEQCVCEVFVGVGSDVMIAVCGQGKGSEGREVVGKVIIS